MRKQYYDYYKARGICTCCGFKKAIPGRVYCEECSYKDKTRKKSYDKERKSYYNKRKRELCDAFGICTTCMRRDKYKGKLCIDCYVKSRRYYRNNQLKKGLIPRDMKVSLGQCYFCNSKVVEGKRVCKHHLSILRLNIKNARSRVNVENHKWNKIFKANIIRANFYRHQCNKEVLY